MKISALLIFYFFAIGLCEANDSIETAKAQTYQAIDLHPLRDGMSHWRKRYGRDRNDPMYDPSQIVHIAENMLAYQNADGGWPNNVDWQAQIAPDTVRAIKGERRMVSTFDNHNTFSQIDYLAKVYVATNLDAISQCSRKRSGIYIARTTPHRWMAWLGCRCHYL